MTDSSPVSIDEVRELVAERHRFDEWLSALEARRADTPSHVYERVHGDYLSRRDGVMTQLHAHVAGLEQLLGELDGRASDLGLRARAEEDERAEAMLRHAVGEYDDNKWNEVRSRVESTLETLGGERDELDAHREDVRGLLASARPEAAPEAVAEDSGETSPEAMSEAEAERGASGDRAAGDQDDGDEQSSGAASSDRADSSTPDWLGAMTPASVPSLPSEGGAHTPAFPDDAEKLEFTSPDDERSEPARPDSRSSMWGDREAGSPSAGRDASSGSETGDVFGDATSAGADEKGGEKAGEKGGSGGRDSRDAASGASESGSFDELAFLRSVIDPKAPGSSGSTSSGKSGSGDAQKTLRCTECGTMNLPTEWYCERCGGELAAF